MKRFEYKQVTESSPDFMDHVNAWGRDGWEMISCEVISYRIGALASDGGPHWTWIMMFKRKLPE